MGKTIRVIGARVTRSATAAERIDLTVRDGRILPFGTRVSAAEEYDLSGHLLLPGLINAHDHLEFNLFPRLGRGPYPNATEWARSIYKPDESPIREHLMVPKHVRMHWGGLKNLLSGVTTVAHHNDYESSIFRRGFPIRVLQRYGWAHSLAFSPDLVNRCRRTPSWWPFIVHAAEGTDHEAYAETARLAALGVLDRRTVLVHAVAVCPDDIRTLQKKRTSVAWCPTSNLFTLGRTIERNLLQGGIRVAIGSDSALTADGDLLDELRAARLQGGLTCEDVYRMVTTEAAAVLHLGEGQGEIRESGVADFVAVPDCGQTPAQALAQLSPALIMVAGRIGLVSVAFAANRHFGPRTRLSRIEVAERGEYFVRVKVDSLHAATAKAIGTGYSLAGKRVVV